MYEYNAALKNYPSISENFFQSDDFYILLNKIGWKAIKINSEKKRSKAALLAFSPNKIPFYSNLFPQYSVYYGPTIENYKNAETIDELLLKVIYQIMKCGCISIDIRTPFPYPIGSKYFHKYGFHREIKGGEFQQ